MCDEVGGVGEALAAAPREAVGPAVDPIALVPVDSVEITTLVDNVFDGLLVSDARVRRAGMGTGGTVPAEQFEAAGRWPGWSPSTGSRRWSRCGPAAGVPP